MFFVNSRVPNHQN